MEVFPAMALSGFTAPGRVPVCGAISQPWSKSIGESKSWQRQLFRARLPSSLVIAWYHVAYLVEPRWLNTPETQKELTGKTVRAA